MIYIYEKNGGKWDHIGSHRLPDESNVNFFNEGIRALLYCHVDGDNYGKRIEAVGDYSVTCISLEENCVIFIFKSEILTKHVRVMRVSPK